MILSGHDPGDEHAFVNGNNQAQLEIRSTFPAIDKVQQITVFHGGRRIATFNGIVALDDSALNRKIFVERNRDGFYFKLDVGGGHRVTYCGYPDAETAKEQAKKKVPHVEDIIIEPLIQDNGNTGSEQAR